MTPEQAIAVTKRLTYRPGWKIECYVPQFCDALVLRVGRMEPDAERKDSAPVPVVLTDSLRLEALSLFDEPAFLGWVFEVFEKRVKHELKEWLRVDGKPLYEPHPEKGWKRGVLE